MSLKDTIFKMDFQKTSVYDNTTGCIVDRDDEKDIILTMDGGNKSVTYTLKELLRGPCAGYRSPQLEYRIREVMTQFLHDAQEYGPCIEEDM